MKRLVALLPWIALAVLAGGCRTTRPPPSPNLLRVGIAPTHPPLCFLENREPAGLEVAFAKALGSALKREVVFVTLPFDAVLDAVQQGQVDIAMSGIAITESRALKAAFTRPYLTSGQLALARTTDGITRDNLIVALSMARRIGVERGTLGERFARNHFESGRIGVFRDIRDAIPKLQKNTLQLVIHDAPVIAHLAATHDTAGLAAVPALITREDLAWAVNHGNLRLLEQVNQVLDEWITEGKVEATIRRWMPYHERYGLLPASHR
jgi:ABC-type amino acid transport substrate-binding protein